MDIQPKMLQMRCQFSPRKWQQCWIVVVHWLRSLQQRRLASHDLGHLAGKQRQGLYQLITVRHTGKATAE